MDEKIKEDEMSIACSTMEDTRNGNESLVSYPNGRGSLGKPMSRWEDIKTDLEEMGWEGVYWIRLAQDRDQ
jgi:hypothetical protein